MEDGCLPVENPCEGQIVAEHLLDLYHTYASRQGMAERLPGLWVAQFSSFVPNTKLVAVLNPVCEADVNIRGIPIDIYDLWLRNAGSRRGFYDLRHLFDEAGSTGRQCLAYEARREVLRSPGDLIDIPELSIQVNV